MLRANGQTGTELYNITEPVYYVAPDAISKDEITVQFWGRVHKGGGSNMSIINGDTVSVSGGKIQRKVGGGDSLSWEELLKQMQKSVCPIGIVAVVEPKLIIFPENEKGEYLITSEPKMPEDLVLIAVLQGAPKDVAINYYWKMTVKWTDPIGKEWELEKPIEREITREVGVDTWVVEWGDKFVGGDEITVEAKATVGTKEYKAEPIVNKFKILGKPERIREAYADLSDYERAVMYEESRYRQFASYNNNDNKVKYPLVNVNRGNSISIDRGIKQINSCHEKDGSFKLEHVWNWRKNKELGMRILNERKRIAAAWPGKIRDASNWKKDHPYSKEGYRGCPDFHPDSLYLIWKETYRRYNGAIDKPYWTWVPNDLEDPDSGGYWSRIVYTGEADNASKYADRVWGYTQNHPDGW